MAHYSPRGSLWHRWDLHFHTPSSYDYLNKGATNHEIVAALLANDVRVVAVTDHHRIDPARIKGMRAEAGDKLTILPGIEFRSELGGSEFVHFIGIFSEEQDVDDLWTKLAGKLDLTEADLAKKGDDNVYRPFVETAKVIRELGGVVTVHAGKKTNTIENLKNSDYIKQIVKKDLVRDYIDIYEVGAVADCEGYVKNVFPHLDRAIPLILCSDNHNAGQYSAKAPLWIRTDPTFRGLLMVLREPQGRVFIGNKPEEVSRIEQSPTKYVRSVTFFRKPGAPANEHWFDGTVEFNPGLVAIIGNKGSGKSALADTLGLLGATKNDGFSFLSRDRFRRSSGGFAQFFDAQVCWESGDGVKRCLADQIPPADVERIKYLPQDHVEKVCNELVGTDETAFEKELKSVIFSHVPDAQRLGQATLDELVTFKTGEKQKRIDALVRQLKEASRDRAALETQANPDARRELEEKIKQKTAELENHDKAKPEQKPDPAAATDAPKVAPDLLKSLGAAEEEKRLLESHYEAQKAIVSTEERKLAVAKRLLEKIGNFGKEFEVFRTGLEADATELGIAAGSLVNLTIDKARIEAIRDASQASLSAANRELNPAQDGSVAAKLGLAKQKLAEIQSQLDAPNRAYQAYLKDVADWAAKRKVIEGGEAIPDSLKGMHARLATFDTLPARIAAETEKQLAIACEIQKEKVAQAEVYRALYQPVQSFIDSHALAKDKLKLEFRAELTDVSFMDSLIGLLALNRRGTFMGTDEGRARAEQLVEGVKWDDATAVKEFLTRVDAALHVDKRDEAGHSVQLKDQLPKGRKAEDVFDMLFSLQYVEPKYVLRWDGKDLAMLSPGERGTLLLVFYLLIDMGDMPLVIDQPEGNLDNHTVAKVLVDCIREARRRRQVFIVTHNPNLAVVCDADQVVHASIDKAAGNRITYRSGSLENPLMTQYVTDVLEGTRWAFGVRGEKYKIGDKRA